LANQLADTITLPVSGLENAKEAKAQKDSACKQSLAGQKAVDTQLVHTISFKAAAWRIQPFNTWSIGG
jgi:hypothetical protein